MRKSIMALVVLGLAMSTFGCMNGLKKENASLKAQVTTLTDSVTALQEENQLLRSDNAALSGQLSQSRAEVSAKADELTSMAQKLKEQGFDVTTRDGMMIVTMPAKILFASGSAGLAGAGASRLKQLAGSLNGPLAGYAVEVQGHTDNEPILRTKDKYKSNWELSYARAQNVAYALMKDGVDAKRVHVTAYGQYHPVASNATNDGKAKNRRVEIVVMKQGAAAK